MRLIPPERRQARHRPRWSHDQLHEEGGFPKSVSLGERAVAWVESEVMGWVMARIEARDAGQGKRWIRRHPE
ncbi:AlpA family phage regulatory protein [Pseudomonas sp. GG8]